VPRVTWRKDGRHISAHRRYRYHNYHSQLSIADVQSSDEATYTCRGTNDHGSVEQKIFLDVQGINDDDWTESGHKGHRIDLG